MKKSTLEIPYTARCVYTACYNILRECREFRSIKGDERTFRIIASKGLMVFGENLIVNVTATSSSSCQVTFKSSDKLLFNLLKFGNNVRNVKDFDQFVRNAVFRLCDPSQLGINPTHISLTKPEIKFW